MSSRTGAAGIAGINAIANLTGGGAISLVGMIKQASGSYAIGLLPIVALTATGAIGVLWMTREQAPAAVLQADSP